MIEQMKRYEGKGPPFNFIIDLMLIAKQRLEMDIFMRCSDYIPGLNRNERWHTGGLSPAKNELTGGAPLTTSPPAIPAGESVEIGEKVPRSFKAETTSRESLLSRGGTRATAVEARRRGRRKTNMLISTMKLDKRDGSFATNERVIHGGGDDLF